ncbi:MAG: transposase [Phycisphaerales bacterium]|nr:transposase [Phycisphaerales bacterium]
MARPLRIEIAGGLYHVTSRGDALEAIYRCVADRLAWLDLFGEVCARFNWVCHAWCQMGNHYHVVVETADGNLAAGMRHLNGVYTQVFNRRRRRVGHVFQGRYKAILVEKESHLLALARYVVLNPVRVGLVAEPGTWRWSSYNAMVGRAPAPPWLQTDWILRHFAETRGRAVRAYQTFVRAGIAAPPVWSELRGQIYLGSPSFADRCRALAETEELPEVPRAQRCPAAPPIERFRRQTGDRREAMVNAFASGDHSLREIADAFGCHYSTVSRAVRRARDRAIRARGG